MYITNRYCGGLEELSNKNNRIMNIQELPLNIILRILSLLGREDLVEVGACSHLLRRLANHVLLLNNLLIRSQADWMKSSFFFDMSQMALEFIWHEDDGRDDEEQPKGEENEGREEEYGNDGDGKFLLDVYGEALLSNNEDTVSYIKILQKVHEEATRIAESDHMRTPEHRDWEIKLERPWKVISPSISDYSKSSSNSTFSELPPPRLSSSESGFPLDESDGSDDSDSITSVDSLDRLRTSKKVKDKAALFEKLMLKDVNHKSHRVKSTQRKLEKRRQRSYRLLAHFFPDRGIMAGRGTISQDYIKEFATATSNAPLKAFTSECVQKNGNCDVEELTEICPRENNNLKTRGNRLKAFVTDENRICYEKI